MKVNVRRGLNRLFIVLAAGWALYWLFIFPLVAVRQGNTHYETDLKWCYDMYGPFAASGPFAKYKASPDREALKNCLSDSLTEHQTGINSGFHFLWDNGEYWSFMGYYRHEGWRLVELIIIPSLVAYGLAWGAFGLALGFRAVCQWIWRGFKPAAAS